MEKNNLRTEWNSRYFIRKNALAKVWDLIRFLLFSLLLISSIKLSAQGCDCSQAPPPPIIICPADVDLLCGASTDPAFTGEAEPGVILPPPDLTPQEREIIRTLMRRLTDVSWAVREHGVEKAKAYLDATQARQPPPERAM